MPCFPLNLHFKILQTLFQLFLLISEPFRVEQTLFLLENVALPAGQLQLTAARFFLFDLPLKLLRALSITFARFSLHSVRSIPSGRSLSAQFFGPPYQKLLDLAAVYGLVHLLIQPADLLQRIQLFLLTLRQQFVPFIIPDVLLHQLNIGFIRNIADVLRNKFWISTIGRNETAFFIIRKTCSLWTFHFASMLWRYSFEYRKILPVHSSASKTAKCRSLHCLALLNKAIFRQCPRVNKRMYHGNFHRCGSQR